MAKKKKKKKQKRSAHLKQPETAHESPASNTEPLKKSPEKGRDDNNRLPSVAHKFWKIIVGIGVIAGILVTYEPVKSWFQSSTKLHDNEIFDQGDLNPPLLIKNDQSKEPNYFADAVPNFSKNVFADTFPEIKGILIPDFNKQELIYVLLGKYFLLVPPSWLYKGLDLFKIQEFSCANSTLILGVKDNRMYVSTEFKRLQNEETMGIIEFNHWKLLKQNYLTCFNNDSMLEVRDRQNKIAFSIKYTQRGRGSGGHPGVIMSGYFIGDSTIGIYNSGLEYVTDTLRQFNCIPMSENNWKQKALIEISRIRSITGSRF